MIVVLTFYNYPKFHLVDVAEQAVMANLWAPVGFYVVVQGHMNSTRNFT